MFISLLGFGAKVNIYRSPPHPSLGGADSLIILKIINLYLNKKKFGILFSIAIYKLYRGR